MMRRLAPALTLALAGLLAGCATGPVPIDDSIRAVGQDSRVRYVVLHYTDLPADASLRVLSQQQVSVHYLITDANPPHVYRLVPETRNAWHAGASSWYGEIELNNTSIGIEIVNLANSAGAWQPYTQGQIDTLLPLLRDIVQRHGIAPQNIVGHSDIAPQRKIDPGPLFPWRLLAQNGLGRWYDEAAQAAQLARLQNEPLPDVSWFQQQLQRLGYECPQDGQLTPATRRVIAAFQMHYRPSRYDGTPDAETAAIMIALK
ncbi:MAG TPA: N-acetylmuramoyl-L-alanine amidase [Bordetella sp.]